MSRPGPGCTTFAALHPPSGLPTVPDVSHRPFRCSEIKVVAMQVTRRASGSPCCGHAGWPYAHALHAAAGITLVRDRGCEAVGGRRAVVRYRVPSRFPRTPPAVGAVARGVRYGQRPHDRDRAVRAVTGQRTRQDASCAYASKTPSPPPPSPFICPSLPAPISSPLPSLSLESPILSPRRPGAFNISLLPSIRCHPPPSGLHGVVNSPPWLSERCRLSLLDPSTPRLLQLPFLCRIPQIFLCCFF